MADKTILQLPNGIPILSDTSVFSDAIGTFGYTFNQLLSLLQLNLSVGAVLTFGSDPIPSNITGSNGDVYWKTDTGQIAQRQSGSWVVVYTLSEGVQGTVIYYGSIAPDSGTGVNGDTYIQTSGGIFYQKISGVWTAKFTMATGPTGPRGNSVLNGSGAPSSLTGVDGDFYYDPTGEIMYGPKATGTWPSGVSLKGANGNTLLNGTTNPSNTVGVNGDFYINTTTQYIFGPKALGVWGTGVPFGSSTSIIEMNFAIGVTTPNTITSGTTFNQIYNLGRTPAYSAYKLVVSGTNITINDITIEYTFTEGLLTQMIVYLHDDGTGHNQDNITVQFF